ncbi:hypothetical protein GUJ93_ZPchr0004g40499 [Zizania palustris]|uniref:CCHC-type domain-containing protein n=1 Tax=Zizania palustris TaxID=103762 RepID=A0A8J5SR57_ZIZPA|nr:hypothetical protein GUJ93_ZPchr0004g40499 [Zizania palustris]
MGTPEKDSGGLKILTDGSNSQNVAAERVVNTNSVELPMLTKTNYHEWSLVMQWEERCCKRGKEHARGGEAWRGADGRRFSDDDRIERDDDAGSTVSGHNRRGGYRSRGRCFECGERGHIARHCREKKKEQALLADTTEEPALL